MEEKIINRVFKYLDEQNIPHTRFEKEIGLSNGYLKTMLRRHADLGESVLLKIIDNSLRVNIIWLITGIGEMFNTIGNTSTVSEPEIEYKRTSEQENIAALRKVIETQDKTIKALEMVIATKSKEEEDTHVITRNK